MSEPRDPPVRGLALLAALAAAELLRLSGPLRPGRPAGPAPEAPDGPHNPAGFEARDVDAGRTALVVLGLAGSVASAIVAVAVMMHLFRAWNVAGTPALTPQQTAVIRPPPPNLQGAPYRDLARQEARERGLVDGYGYVDAGRSRARIPVERAMALMAGRPLDPPAPAAPPAAGPDAAPRP
ncbi:hypothetical protein OPKNFCMD_0589 [Methylobacterium crusticola]|uniref:DUF4129 domain-containing protein n=1 Tax=Methylobacterium crusticola TaxID=1697972 RepID=A0ABQ4QRF0_9HYPH|nr:hypothetical protein [Methylobacterium crusticola]GJD47877.1 hypothetical protein OPKNFCMD_0589 [Methylobacterium crusticola]